jgi:hypothetical protein
MMGRIKMGLRIPQKGMEKGDPKRDAKGACSKEHGEEMIQGSHKETIGM